MKKTMCILWMSLLLLALAIGHRPPVDPAQGVLRLHILANSDSPADQAAKLRVRDALLPLFAAAATYDDAREFVLSHGAALLSVCQTTLADAGAAYGAQLLLGVSDFPDRTYAGVSFPAGAYDALQIILGEGAGHNWWCVLFPPLCIVVPEATPEATSAPAAASPTGIVFESSILAFLRKHFGIAG